jgi:hypothetical protein
MVWSSPEQVVLDLSRLSLMDASDLRTVLALERQSVQQNARLELLAGPVTGPAANRRLASPAPKSDVPYARAASTLSRIAMSRSER